AARAPTDPVEPGLLRVSVGRSGAPRVLGRDRRSSGRRRQVMVSALSESVLVTAVSATAFPPHCRCARGISAQSLSFVNAMGATGAQVVGPGGPEIGIFSWTRLFWPIYARGR